MWSSFRSKVCSKLEGGWSKLNNWNLYLHNHASNALKHIFPWGFGVLGGKPPREPPHRTVASVNEADPKAAVSGRGH